MNYEEAPLPLSGERVTVRYSVYGDSTGALETARAICVEQSIEFPPHLIPQNDFWAGVMGRLEGFESLSEQHHQAVISYALETFTGDIVQLLNIVYGNVSMIRGIRLEEVSLPATLIEQFEGPRLGLSGLRERCGSQDRAMICATLKPMGLSVEAFARFAAEFAASGVEMVKDDHGLTDQPLSPFRERVSRCAEAVQEANQKRRSPCLYAPNVTGPGDQVLDRAHVAFEAGAGALMILPGLTGWDMVRQLRADPALDLPIVVHPSYGGVYYASHEQGLSSGFYYATLARLAGADVSILPNYVGRLYSSQRDCRDAVDAARQPLGSLKPNVMAPGGGITLNNIPEMKQFYGQDIVYVMGGGLHQSGRSLGENCAEFRSMLDAE